MIPDLVQIRALAKKKEDENWDFRQFVKTQSPLNPDEMDQEVWEITKRVWAGIDCTKCANCCRDVQPTFSEEEVNRLAQRLGMTSEQFVHNYLKRSENTENPWQTRTTPCPFLESNRCSVYEDRPADCKNYPYLYEPEFVFRTTGMISRTFTCPIVFEVFEELKRSWGFPQRERRR